MKKKIFVVLVVLLSLLIVWSYFYIIKPFRLIVAAKNNDIALMRELVLTEKYDPQIDVFGTSILGYYLSSQDTDIKAETVAELLKLGASPSPSSAERLPYLSMAIVLDRSDIVEVLLANGADIDAVDKLNMTPLDAALVLHKYTIVNLLLAKNAELLKFKHNEKLYQHSLECVKQKLCDKGLLEKFAVK